MSNPWFRLYSEIIDDEKVQMMPFEHQRHLIMLFALRGQRPTEKMTSQQIAFRLRVSETLLETLHETFLKHGFIEKNWAITNWNKRQFISDSSTDRVKKHRAIIALKQSETFQKRDETENETSPDTDTDTEQIQNRTEKTPPPKAPVFEIPDWVSKDSWVGFMEVRSKKRAPNTLRALNGIVRELEKIRACGTDPNASLEQSIIRGYTGVFEVVNGNGNGTHNPLEKVKFAKLEDFVNQ